MAAQCDVARADTMVRTTSGRGKGEPSLLGLLGARRRLACLLACGRYSLDCGKPNRVKPNQDFESNELLLALWMLLILCCSVTGMAFVLGESNARWHWQ